MVESLAVDPAVGHELELAGYARGVWVLHVDGDPVRLVKASGTNEAYAQVARVTGLLCLGWSLSNPRGGMASWAATYSPDEVQP